MGKQGTKSVETFECLMFDPVGPRVKAFCPTCVRTWPFWPLPDLTRRQIPLMCLQNPHLCPKSANSSHLSKWWLRAGLWLGKKSLGSTTTCEAASFMGKAENLHMEI